MNLILTSTISRYIVPLMKKGDYIYLMYKRYQDMSWKFDIIEEYHYLDIINNNDSKSLEKLPEIDFKLIIKTLFKKGLK